MVMLFIPALVFFWLQLSFAWEGWSNSTTLKASDFAGPFMSPFSPCNVELPSFVKATTGSPLYASDTAKVEAFFNESNYDGTRGTKGAEFCYFKYGASTNEVFFQKEGWQGFALYVPSDTYPTDKASIIAQQFCPGGCDSWCAVVSIEANSLTIDHRDGCVTSTHAVLVDSIVRDEWHTIIVNIRVSSQEAGHYTVWYDNNLVYNETGINIGFGDSWSNDVLSPGVFFKTGMYAYGMFA